MQRFAEKPRNRGRGCAHALSLVVRGVAFLLLPACASSSQAHDPVMDLPQLVGRRALSFRSRRSGDVEILAQDVSYANGVRASTVVGLYREGASLDAQVVVLADALPNALSPVGAPAHDLPDDIRFESTGMQVDVVSFVKVLRGNDSVDVPPCRDKDALHALLTIEAPSMGHGDGPYFRTGEIVCVLPLEPRPR